MLAGHEKGTRSHYRWLKATMWLLGIELRKFQEPLEEQSVLLTSEPPLQPPSHVLPKSLSNILWTLVCEHAHTLVKKARRY